MNYIYYVQFSWVRSVMYMEHTHVRRSRRKEPRVIYEVAVIELVDIGDNFLAKSTNPCIFSRKRTISAIDSFANASHKFFVL